MKKPDTSKASAANKANLAKAAAKAKAMAAKNKAKQAADAAKAKAAAKKGQDKDKNKGAGGQKKAIEKQMKDDEVMRKVSELHCNALQKTSDVITKAKEQIARQQEAKNRECGCPVIAAMRS